MTLAFSCFLGKSMQYTYKNLDQAKQRAITNFDKLDAPLANLCHIYSDSIGRVRRPLFGELRHNYL